MTTLGLSFVAAFLTSVSLTPLMRALALRWNVVDHPGPRKVHRQPTALMGGLAVQLGCSVAVLAFVPAESFGRAAAVLVAANILGAIGLIDDMGHLHSQVKLLLGMPLVAGIMTLAGFRIPTEHLAFLPFPTAALVAISAILTTFWIVGIVAAFSILDHMDGLSSGVATIAGFFFFLIAVGAGLEFAAVLAAAFAGAALAFLLWNFKPAKIFLGDGGAMFLGIIAAALSLEVGATAGSPVGWIVAAFVLVVPVFDTSLVIVSRVRRGLLPFAAPGKDHFAHRIVSIGAGEAAAVLFVCAVGIVGGATAWAALSLPFSQVAMLAGVALLCGGAAIAVLEKTPYERQGPPPAEVSVPGAAASSRAASPERSLL